MAPVLVTRFEQGVIDGRQPLRHLSPVGTRGWRITAATVASHLILWLLLLACLRGTGLSQAQADLTGGPRN